MSPADSTHAVLNRPQFSWDLKSTPWTAGRGDQEHYSNAVQHWAQLYDILPDSNSNKIFAKSCRIILPSNLHSCTWDLCADIKDEIMLCNDASKVIVDHVYKKDPRSVFSVVFAQLQNLLAKRRGERESH